MCRILGGSLLSQTLLKRNPHAAYYKSEIDKHLPRYSKPIWTGERISSETGEMLNGISIDDLLFQPYFHLSYYRGECVLLWNPSRRYRKSPIVVNTFRCDYSFHGLCEIKL